MTRLVAIALAVLAILAGMWAVGRSSAQTSAAEERVRIAEERETVAVLAYHRTRDSIPALQAASERAERTIRNLRTVAAGTMARAETVTVASNAVLADTSATVSDLRTALRFQVFATDSLASAFREYLSADITVHEAYRSERSVLHSALSKAESALAATRAVADGWRTVAQCRIIFGIRCPTRTQTFIGGAIVTAGVILGRR